MAAPETQRFPELSLHRGLQVDAFEDAIFQVLVQDEEASLLKPGSRRQELGEDVSAGPILFEHFPKAADLALYAGEAIEKLLIIFGLHVQTPAP